MKTLIISPILDETQKVEKLAPGLCLNGWKSSYRICGSTMTLQAAWAGQRGEKSMNLSPNPGVITF